MFFVLYLDTDECKNPEVCGENSVCVNTEGSFDCVCAVGYEKVNDQCVGEYIVTELIGDRTVD